MNKEEEEKLEEELRKSPMSYPFKINRYRHGVAFKPCDSCPFKNEDPAIAFDKETGRCFQKCSDEIIVWILNEEQWKEYEKLRPPDKMEEELKQAENEGKMAPVEKFMGELVIEIVSPSFFKKMYNKNMISFEDFQKIDLRVAKVVEAENVEGSEKLLKLKIYLGQDPSTGSGQETRQIVAGIAKFYKPADLIGKEIIVVANLEPKVLRGLESQGMLLAAETEGKVSLLIPDQEVPPGSKIH